MNLIDRIEAMTKKMQPTFVTLTWRSSFQVCEQFLAWPVLPRCSRLLAGFAAFLIQKQDESSWLRIGTLIQKRCGVDVLLHLTCHLPVSDLRRVLRKAREAGIHNILALRGGPSMGDAGSFRPVPGGLRNAIDLVKLIREEHGDYFCVAVAGYPEVHNEAWNSPCLPPSEQAAKLDLERLKQKVDAGADFVLTQFVYDAKLFLKFEKVPNLSFYGCRVPRVVGGCEAFRSASSLDRLLLLLFAVALRASHGLLWLMLLCWYVSACAELSRGGHTLSHHAWVHDSTHV
jgi:5,10-methylenetetrahydrofolate reductase